MTQEAGLIVVADDDADSRDMIAEGLEQLGYEVSWRPTGPS